jgi:ABC-type lipoprotein export system ATPase subunit
MLADEPTGELDTTTAREVLGLFRHVIEHEQVTILMSSHDQLVDEYVDRVVSLRDGQVVSPEMR